MTRRHEIVINARVTQAEYDNIVRFAADYGMVRPDGKPNVSAAIRQLIGVGLDRGDGIALGQASYRNARAELLQKVRVMLRDRFSDIAEEIQ